jgi:hypothetical protein
MEILSTLKKIIFDERGYGVIEWVIILSITGGIATAVLVKLLPALQNAHTTTVNKITNITESGF